MSNGISKPVGIFDSGVGGLSVAHAIAKRLPSENLCYIADQHFSPYGEKSTEFLLSRCTEITNFLLQQQCKAIVIACNTATVNTIKRLRSQFDIPIIGVEPGVKPAAQNSKVKRIAVLATSQTIASDSFNSLKQRFSSEVQIEVKACPEFVSLVEQGITTGPKAQSVVREYLTPVLANGADQIVLGCTHFVFLLPVIEEIVAGSANIIDTADAVARQLAVELSRNNLLEQQERLGEIQGWSSDLNTSEVMCSLWGKEFAVDRLGI